MSDELLVKPLDRRHEWIQTYTGKAFWLLHPNVQDVDIRDIAHGLSNICRYNGQTKYFYSIAQHSLLLSQLASAPNKRWALLHDAAEAYLVEMPKVVEQRIGAVSLFKDQINQAIIKRFNLPQPMPEEISQLDKHIVVNERDALFTSPPYPWRIIGLPIPNLTINPMTPKEAEELFLSTYINLTTS